MNRVLRWLRVFLVTFFFIAFIVTCNMVLFLHSMNIDAEILRTAAPVTFVNVLFLSALFSIVDVIRRYFTVERPLEKIEYAMQQIMKGNYAYQIPLTSATKEFDVIIQNLNVMAKELSSVEVLRTDFISNVSHEMKTPLAILQNYSQLLQSNKIDETARKEYAREIMNQTQKMSLLISNILKLTKLEKQQIFPTYETFDVMEHLCECMLAYEDLWEKKQLQIETELEENVKVVADKELLQLIWDNLMSNAIKFTEDKGTICLRCYTEGNYAVVEVQDSGCGMNAETGKHIFQKFYQGDTSHKTEGNGLGLALVKRIVDILDAEISVKSKLHEGSTFTVRLRLAKDA